MVMRACNDGNIAQLDVLSLGYVNKQVNGDAED
jgi:hypothetical protein